MNEDHRIISAFGFEKWPHRVLYGALGILEEITVGGQVVHRYTLMQGRVQCVCLYTEDEFKELVIEADYTCRYHFNNDKRCWSWCCYYKLDFLIKKNVLSYHCHKDQCSTWKKIQGGSMKVCKMYPTFCPSDQNIISGIFLQGGLAFPVPPEIIL